MTGADPDEGNRLIFKPSPLASLMKTARHPIPEPPQAGPSEVTAVPQEAAEPEPASAPSPATAPHRDDLTTFSFEPLPATPGSAQPASSDGGQQAAFHQGGGDRLWLYVLLAAAAGAILVALVWFGRI